MKQVFGDVHNISFQERRIFISHPFKLLAFFTGAQKAALFTFQLAIVYDFANHL